jgi:GTP-binding protein
MHFIDRVDVLIQAGDGGNGLVSFRREKFVDKGGPDGGDGGKGGDIIFHANRNENTLAAFRFKKELIAKSGEPGGKRKKHGKSAEDLVVAVPVGTIITDDSGTIIADLAVDGQREIVAKGGNGGFGNAHFISSVRQAPKIAEKGEPGERLHISMELKLIADVGLVGLPNAGKSTLLSVISNARPEIADYPFTTLTPNLGVVDIDRETSTLFADIPGLIEGAAQGKGLGDEFLRHVERTLVLVHVIDAYQDDVTKAYHTIQEELAAYKTDVSAKPQVIALNKTEGLDEEIIADLVSQLQKVVPEGAKILPISAQAHKGTQELLFAVKDILLAERRKQLEAAVEEDQETEGLPVLTLRDDDNTWRVAKEEGAFVVTGARIERFAVRTDFDNPHGVARLKDIMKKMGILHELLRQGIESGDKVVIANKGEFTF